MTNSEIFSQNISSKPYITPEISIIKLDNDISLALESDPAVGPGEQVYNIEGIASDPFKTQTV